MPRIVKPELPENKSMSKHSTDLDANSRESWQGRVALPALRLLLIVALVFSAGASLATQIPRGAQSPTNRVGWYLRSGQWHADIRTLAAAFQFIADCDSDDPVQTNAPGNPLATPAARPGPNPPGNCRMKDADICPTHGCPGRRAATSPI